MKQQDFLVSRVQRYMFARYIVTKEHLDSPPLPLPLPLPLLRIIVFADTLSWRGIIKIMSKSTSNDVILFTFSGGQAITWSGGARPHEGDKLYFPKSLGRTSDAYSRPRPLIVTIAITRVHRNVARGMAEESGGKKKKNKNPVARIFCSVRHRRHPFTRSSV